MAIASWGTTSQRRPRDLGRASRRRQGGLIFSADEHQGPTKTTPGPPAVCQEAGQATVAARTSRGRRAKARPSGASGKPDFGKRRDHAASRDHAAVGKTGPDAFPFDPLLSAAGRGTRASWHVPGPD